MLRKALLFSSFSLSLVLGSFVTVASADQPRTQAPLRGYPKPPTSTTQPPTTNCPGYPNTLLLNYSYGRVV
jgi:hypothetical protein